MEYIVKLISEDLKRLSEFEHYHKRVESWLKSDNPRYEKEDLENCLKALRFLMGVVQNCIGENIERLKSV